MDCDKAQEAMMQYADKLIKPSKAAALARHVLKCGDCRERFLLFDAAMDGTFVLTEAPEGFTGAVMEKVRLLPAYVEIRRAGASRADIVVRILWGLCAIMLGLGLSIMYNQEMFTAFLAKYPRFAALNVAVEAIGRFFSATFEQSLLTLGQIGQQAVSLLSNVSNMSLVFVVLSAALLVVMLRGEKIKA